MKYILLSSTVSLLFFASAFAQVTVKGIVTEANSGKKPLSGVQILVLGATPEISDNSGNFQLVFPDKKPGDRLIVSRITRKGYELLNSKAVFDNWLVPANKHEVFEVVMCPEGMVAQNAARYYQISLEALTRGYKNKVRELTQRKDSALMAETEYRKQMQNLETSFLNQQKQIEAMADRFARENFDNCSEIHQRAFTLFKEGNIEEAIRILESVDSGTEISNARAQKERGKALEKSGNEMQEEAMDAIGSVEKLRDLASSYASLQQTREAEARCLWLTPRVYCRSKRIYFQLYEPGLAEEQGAKYLEIARLHQLFL